MRSMAFRLAVGFAAVALVGVVIASFISNRLTATEFGRYLQGTVTQEQRAADYLAYRYSSDGGWPGVTPTVPTLALWLERRLVVTDGSGRIVVDSAGRLAPNATPPSPPSDQSLPIVADGKTVGALFLLSDVPTGTGTRGGMMGGAGMMGQGSAYGSAMLSIMQQMVDLAGSPEQRFLQAVNRALWMAGGIALVVAVLLGLAISRQITAPLHRITMAARRVAGGDFSQQVEVKSKDELATLAEAFNIMAATLARNEQQRKQLLGDIAHELKTPLSIVQGNLEGMMDGVVEATPTRLASLREEILLLNRLVTDLRDISVAEAGHLRLHLEPVDVGELIQLDASAVQAQAEARGVKLDVHLEEGLPLVTADADRVAQVLRNLVSNALRYTPSGGVITLAAATSSRPSAISYQPSTTGEGAPSPISQHPSPNTQHLTPGTRHPTSWSPSRTLARASHPRTCPTFSTASTGLTSRGQGPAAAPASASRWQSSWSRPMVEGFGPRASPAKARHSTSPCPSPFRKQFDRSSALPWTI